MGKACGPEWVTKNKGLRLLASYIPEEFEPACSVHDEAYKDGMSRDQADEEFVMMVTFIAEQHGGFKMWAWAKFLSYMVIAFGWMSKRPRWWPKVQAWFSETFGK